MKNERTTAALSIEEATEKVFVESYLKRQQREMVFSTIPFPSGETI
jgi:hypothetical protein